MLTTTKAIVLRSVKYGETSIVTQLFTAQYGVQSFLVKGVRKSKDNRAALLQPSTLLQLETEIKPNKSLQHLRNFHSDYLFQTVRESVVKNSVILFSTEVLLRLLPGEAPLEELFEFSYDFFQKTDEVDEAYVANLPLYFLIQIGNILGYEIKGDLSAQTPYLNLSEGSFSSYEAPDYILSNSGRQVLSQLLTSSFETTTTIKISGADRYELTDWYLEFLRVHSQHMGTIKSLEVLRAILH
jgi:DNA repair protein RecO (recombination protein O)